MSLQGVLTPGSSCTPSGAARDMSHTRDVDAIQTRTRWKRLAMLTNTIKIAMQVNIYDIHNV